MATEFPFARENFPNLTPGVVVCSNPLCKKEWFCHLEAWGFPQETGKCKECNSQIRSLSWEPGV